MKPSPFGYSRPESLEQTVALLGRYGSEAKVLAGGQSLLPLLSMRLAAPRQLIDINRVRELAYIRTDGDAVRVGALARQADVERDDAVGCGATPVAAGLAAGRPPHDSQSRHGRREPGPRRSGRRAHRRAGRARRSGAPGLGPRRPHRARGRVLYRSVVDERGGRRTRRRGDLSRAASRTVAARSSRFPAGTATTRSAARPCASPSAMTASCERRGRRSSPSARRPWSSS